MAYRRSARRGRGTRRRATRRGRISRRRGSTRRTTRSPRIGYRF